MRILCEYFEYAYLNVFLKKLCAFFKYYIHVSLLDLWSIFFMYVFNQECTYFVNMRTFLFCMYSLLEKCTYFRNVFLSMYIFLHVPTFFFFLRNMRILKDRYVFFHPFAYLFACTYLYVGRYFDKIVCICTYFMYGFLEPCPVFIRISLFWKLASKPYKQVIRRTRVYFLI